jgi:hypothetical protein
MSLRFLGQPFEDATQIGRVLNAALRDSTMTTLWAATAWAKQSGLSRIRSAVLEFRDNGGTSEVVVGIDEGGATREGLSLCLDLFDQTFVYHDPGPRTFHPKIYAVEGNDRAMVIVGSGNLTKGGLFTNYEAAFLLDAARGEPDWDTRDEVRRYFDTLRSAGDAVRRLDADLIEQLAEEGWVTSEARQNRRRSADSRERRDREPLFGSAVTGLAGAPPSELAALPAEEEDEDSALPPATTAVIDAEDAGIEPPDREDHGEEEETTGETVGFWKRLSNWDASGSSAPGQIQIPIQFLDFFPTLSDEVALTAGLGQGQSAAYFDVDFKDGPFTKHVEQARVILYEPAPHQARPNAEIRFTFHDREVFERLAPLDVLVFTEHEGHYAVERRDPGSMGAGRWGWLA